MLWKEKNRRVEWLKIMCREKCFNKKGIIDGFEAIERPHEMKFEK